MIMIVVVDGTLIPPCFVTLSTQYPLHTIYHNKFKIDMLFLVVILMVGINVSLSLSLPPSLSLSENKIGYLCPAQGGGGEGYMDQSRESRRGNSAAVVAAGSDNES